MVERESVIRADETTWASTWAHDAVWSLGDKPVSPGHGFISLKPIRYLMLFVLPWPKGRVQTHPELLETQPAEFNGDRARLRGLLERIAQRGREGGAFQPHPAFGDLSTQEWGGLVYRHVRHHLAQFSV